MDYPPEAIRTIALVGHAGCGKTSLIEALLKEGGAIHAAGSVDRGSTGFNSSSLICVRFNHSP